MVNYDIIILIFGLAFLASAWLSPKLPGRPFTFSIIWLGIGFFVAVIDTRIPDVNPLKNSLLTEHLTELAIILSLLSAGLKIDRSMNWYKWNDTWRLLGITMPLCIGLMMLTSYYVTDLPLVVALLLGALIAPTDPVLASDVQVGPPGQGNEHDVRFALTSEAGMNDGLAFPFVMLAMAFTVSNLEGHYLLQWFFIDVIWKIFAGVIGGSLIGYLTAKLILKPTREMAINDDFIAIALAFLAYGGSQLIHGYGFLGVFIAAYVFRHYQHDHKFHTRLHNFSEQIEHLITPMLLVIMGIFIYQGVFTHLSIGEITVSLIFLLIIRPISGLAGLIGSKTTMYNRLIISIFGIRGIGSFYYLAYALNKTRYFEKYGQQLWRITILIVLISIVLHGISASILFQRLTSLRK